MSWRDDSEFESQSSRLSKYLAMRVRVLSFYSVRIDGYEFQMNHSGFKSLEFVSKLSRSSRAATSLIQRRFAIEPLISHLRSDNSGRGGRLAIECIMKYTSDSELLRLVIWLIGRGRVRVLLKMVARHRFHPDWRVRKEVARTLHRIQGWRYLQDMEDAERHPRVRRLATQQNADSFDSRLHRWKQISQSCNNRESKRQPMYVDPSVRIGFQHEPKPIELIRYILKRIQNALYYK